MPRRVVVRAPSRLHFGLFALTNAAGRQFGGVGAMVQQPELRLRIEPGQAWQALGPMAARIDDAAERWRQFHNLQHKPDCQVAVERVPPEHVGLGLGTQLALSVAAGLSAFCGLPAGAPQELAVSVGRGRRSAVGTYGFALGGLIVEQGKLPGELVSPLDTRIDLPESWRFVLVRPLAVQGLCGEPEQTAIDCMAPDWRATQELIREVRERLVPAAAMGQFGAFSESLYRYNQVAGSFYAPQQGGAYNGPTLTTLVDLIRSWGHAGVGQSSWGPTLFVAQCNATSAQELAGRLSHDWQGESLEILITKPTNRGAEVIVDELGSDSH